jgi:SPP1 family predicted phage head-tail adaptor
MDIGKMNHWVRLEQLVNQVDSNGDVIQDENTGEITTEWELVEEVWASIEPLSVLAFIQSGATQSQVDSYIGIWFRTDIQPSWRVVEGDTIYNIRGILPDKKTGREYLTLPCFSGVSDGR